MILYIMDYSCYSKLDIKTMKWLYIKDKNPWIYIMPAQFLIGSPLYIIKHNELNEVLKHLSTHKSTLSFLK